MQVRRRSAGSPAIRRGRDQSPSQSRAAYAFMVPAATGEARAAEPYPGVVVLQAPCEQAVDDGNGRQTR
jgi:hypothetical protein